MGRSKADRLLKQKMQTRKGGNGPAQMRPMQGMDTKGFVFNDIRPIIIPAPSNSNEYLVTITGDINGFTYSVAELSTGLAVQTASSTYGQRTGQFAAQGFFFDQYQLNSVEFDLTLSQGGAVMSLSPSVTQVNPNGATPFVYTPGSTSYLDQLSASQNVHIHNPYQATRTQLEYRRWLISMSDRAWRQTQSVTGVGRELYPSDGSGNEFFKLPSLVKAFTVTIPNGVFTAGSGPLVLGFVQFRSHYTFSQRRTNISQLVNSMLADKEEIARADERRKLSERIKSDMSAGLAQLSLEEKKEEIPLEKTTPDMG